MKSVVRVFQNEKDTNKITFGTGTIIGRDGTILTCAHVVDGTGKIDVMFGDGLTNAVYSAKVIQSDAKLDLALLKLEGCPEHLRPMPLSKMPTPPRGTPVVAIGSPLKIFRTATQGIVSYAGPDEGQDILVFDARVMPGCSGGPVIDESGDLIGIVTGDLGRDTHRLARAVYLTEIEKFLANVSSNAPQRGFLGIDTTPVGTGIAGPGMSEGLKVTNMSAIDELLPGDVIMTFNDYQATNHKDLVRMVRKCTPGDRVEVGILRNGEFKLIHMIIKELRK
jgi:serine protease Do